MQGIYTHIPETNYVPREHGVAAILLFLFMVLISLLAVLNLLYFYISTFRRMCAVPNIYYYYYYYYYYTEVTDRCRMCRFLPHHPRISVLSCQITPLYSFPSSLPSSLFIEMPVATFATGKFLGLVDIGQRPIQHWA